jgi:hypothetical protein
MKRSTAHSGCLHAGNWAASRAHQSHLLIAGRLDICLRWKVLPIQHRFARILPEPITMHSVKGVGIAGGQQLAASAVALQHSCTPTTRTPCTHIICPSKSLSSMSPSFGGRDVPIIVSATTPFFFCSSISLPFDFLRLTSHHFLSFPNHPASSLSHILTPHISTLSFSTYSSLLAVTFWLYYCRQVSALVQTTRVCGRKLPVYEALRDECMRP